jgi:hypothetical protein
VIVVVLTLSLSLVCVCACVCACVALQTCIVSQQYKNSSRRELQQKFREMGSLLIPLLQSLQKNIMRAFDPLPYTELPGVRTLSHTTTHAAHTYTHLSDDTTTTHS